METSPCAAFVFLALWACLLGDTPLGEAQEGHLGNDCGHPLSPRALCCDDAGGALLSAVQGDSAGCPGAPLGPVAQDLQ